MRALVWATVDTLSCLLLVVLAAINPPLDPARAALETYGRYAVVLTWPAGDNDVDTWYASPDGRRVWFNDSRSTVAHLEQDDLGTRSDTDPKAVNRERVVIRSILPGEHIVNVHAYGLSQPPVTVKVELWRLQGADRRLYSVRIRLTTTGDERTAFRFSLDRSGVLQNLNRLPASLVTR